MIPKYIAQIIIGVSRVVGRAVGKAIKEEYAASQQASKSRNTDKASPESIYTDLSSGISLEEAKLILDIKDINDLQSVDKNFNHLFEMNDKSKGGSLYMQSKVYRAKERLDEELRKLKCE